MRVDSNNFVSNVAAKFESELPEQDKAGRSSKTGVPEAGRSGTTASKAQLSASAVNDVVHFSSNADRVESLKAQALLQPEIRDAKVQSLQNAIGNGEYSVSPSQIAGALKSELRTDVYG